MIIILYLISMTSYAQINLKLTTDSTKYNITNQLISKGDEFEVDVYGDGTMNNTTRSLYFDFEYQNSSFELLSVTNTGTISQGGILPNNSQITMDYYKYPGYSWNPTQNNTTINGNTNYTYASYTYNQNGIKTILRVYLNWATTNNVLSKGVLLKLRFRLKSNAVGYQWDPIKMNFGAAYNQSGTSGYTVMSTPLTNIILLNPILTSLINGYVNVNTNLANITPLKVRFENDTLKSSVYFDVTSNGIINIDQSKLLPNTNYNVTIMVSMDKLYEIYNSAITISDYTMCQYEFVRQNLDGTFNNINLVNGVNYLSSDVNYNKTFDGGDLTKLYATSVSLDTLVILPKNYVYGSNELIELMTFTSNDFNELSVTSWKDLSKTYVKYKTGEIGSNQPLYLSYLLNGDINLSHSSQLNNRAARMKLNNNIDISLNNLTILSNSVEIPINVDTKNNDIMALQLEFNYDQNKLFFEGITTDLPNSWVVFVNSKNGKVKFGAVDNNIKTPLNGKVNPFKLKFTTKENGLDINSFIKINKNYDSSDKKGNKIDINLNTDKIKLTGLNNF